MKIKRAAHLGMCFGVRDAISHALEKSRTGTVTVLGELVHNRQVLQMLEENNIRIAKELSEVETPEVIISAHGASDKRINTVRQAGFQLTEATCPLVMFAHRQLRRLVNEGCYPVVIGRRGHVEVNGLTEDLAEVTIVGNEIDLEAVPERKKYGVVAQTTQPIEKVNRIFNMLKERYPSAEFHFADTVCMPTKQRQVAAIELAETCSVVVVIGGRNSNNTNELAQTCARHGARTYKIESAAELRPEWFKPADSVGITAGTSTPDHLVDEVEQWLLRLDVCFSNESRGELSLHPQESGDNRLAGSRAF